MRLRGVCVATTTQERARTWDPLPDSRAPLMTLARLGQEKERMELHKVLEDLSAHAENITELACKNIEENVSLALKSDGVELDKVAKRRVREAVDRHMRIAFTEAMK